jgi:hypothetical protein
MSPKRRGRRLRVQRLVHVSRWRSGADGENCGRVHSVVCGVPRGEGTVFLSERLQTRAFISRDWRDHRIPSFVLFVSFVVFPSRAHRVAPTGLRSPGAGG